MKIYSILSTHRFDFTAIMQCQFCDGFQTNPSGYDDLNYHNEVIPRIECLWCGKNSAGSDNAVVKGKKIQKAEKLEMVTKWEFVP